MLQQGFEDKSAKFQKDLRDLGVKVSLAFHQICILLSPRAFWKSAELQDFTHQSHIPCSPQGKRLLQASFGRRACSSKEARWVLGLFSFFPSFRDETLDACSNISGKAISLTPYIGRSSWLVLAERSERRCISPALSRIWDRNFQLGGSGELLWVVWRCSPPQSAPLLLEEGIMWFSLCAHCDGEACKVPAEISIPSFPTGTLSILDID